jgi:hypothetical protein
MNLKSIMDFTSNKEENHGIRAHNDKSWKEKAKENGESRVHVTTIENVSECEGKIASNKRN